MGVLKSILLRCAASAIVCVAMAGCDRGSSSQNPAATAPTPQAASAPTLPPAGIFEDATTRLGVSFTHQSGGTGHFMPRSIGPGAATFDYDGDGRLDLYLIQTGGPDSKAANQLFHQNEGGTFTNVTAGSGLDLIGWGMGVAAGDVNNDGKVDLVVTEYGRVKLFLNASEGDKPLFTDITADAGVSNIFWGTSAAFLDYDRDGFLDLFITNYISYDPSRWCAGGNGQQEFCGPGSFPGRQSRLFHNLGSAGGQEVRFEDVTQTSGLMTAPGPGLGVFCADFDGDRWPDIFVANDGKPNHLWINQKNGTFKEEAAQRGIAYNSMGKAEANMGIAIGDVNDDGLFDLFVTHLTDEIHRLWTQKPRGFFQDRTSSAGLLASSWRGTGFGAVMADFDNSGGLDLAFVNGRVVRGPTTPSVPGLDPFWHPYAERNQLFMNDGNGVFVDTSPNEPAFSGSYNVGRGLAAADLDSDGGIDLIAMRIAAPAGIYRNASKNRGHWLLVRAIDPKLNRDAYGAEIHIQAGGKKWMRWINPGYSYLCSNDPRAHFGFGDLAKIDALSVIWPDGSEETFPAPQLDRLITLERGKGTASKTQ